MNKQKINNLLKDPNTNWKYVAIVAIIAALVFGGILAYQNLWPTKQKISLPEVPSVQTENAVKELIQDFYKAVEKKNGELAMNYFTPAVTSEEKEEYNFLTGADLPVPGSRIFWRVSISNYAIKEIELVNRNRVNVLATDEFKTYSNVTGEWSDSVLRNITFNVVKSDANWLIDKYIVEGYSKDYPEKYSGFRMTPAASEEIASWDIYGNDKYGYEIKYPLTYQLKFFEENPCFEEHIGSEWCSVNIVANYLNGSSLETYIQVALGLPRDESLEGFFKRIGWEYSWKEINGNSWLYFHQAEGPGMGRYHNFIYQEETVVDIMNFSNLTQKSEIFNQMLSTFKFLE